MHAGQATATVHLRCDSARGRPCTYNDSQFVLPMCGNAYARRGAKTTAAPVQSFEVLLFSLQSLHVFLNLQSFHVICVFCGVIVMPSPSFGGFLQSNHHIFYVLIFDI